MHLYQMYIDKKRKENGKENELIEFSSRKNPIAIAQPISEFNHITANETVFQLNTHWNWTIGQ